MLTASGDLRSAEVEGTSGSVEFDTSALDVVRIHAPYVPAPEEALSDDGKVHLEWTFARDDRRCSGVKVKHLQSPLPEAMKSMVAQGREDVALPRLQAASEAERAFAMSAFAQAWIERASEGQPIAVAVARASSGDPQGADKLRQAIEQGQEVAQAAAGLVHLGPATLPVGQSQAGGTGRAGSRSGPGGFACRNWNPSVCPERWRW